MFKRQSKGEYCERQENVATKEYQQCGEGWLDIYISPRPGYVVWRRV